MLDWNRLTRDALALCLALLPTARLAAAQDACSDPIACLEPARTHVFGVVNGLLRETLAESFQPVLPTTITSACWWGAGTGRETGPECGSTLTDFTITYYHDGPNGPDTIKAGPFDVTASSVATGETTAGLPEYRWTASHPAVDVGLGETVWISITNNASCWFRWGNSTDGDGVHATSGDFGFPLALVSFFDLAVCVGPNACPLFVTVADPWNDLGPLASARTLARAYGLRDRVFAATPTGRRWIRLYYRHGATVRRLLVHDPVLRRRVAALLAVLGPGLDALVRDDDRARTLRVPPHAIALFAGILDELERADAGGELARAIRAERTTLGLAHLCGVSYARAWEEINARG